MRRNFRALANGCPVQELLSLQGHKNVVYAIAFNNPFGDKIITGSFDKTCKVRREACLTRGRGDLTFCSVALPRVQLWDANTGQLYHTLRGHLTEIVCLTFNPQSTCIATGTTGTLGLAHQLTSVFAPP